jgi:hypothetical protein
MAGAKAGLATKSFSLTLEVEATLVEYGCDREPAVELEDCFTWIGAGGTDPDGTGKTAGHDVERMRIGSLGGMALVDVGPADSAEETDTVEVELLIHNRTGFATSFQVEGCRYCSGE